MKNLIRISTAVAVTVLVLCFPPIEAEAQPEPNREFRAVWIATVDNIDFPSKKTLTVAEQKAELIRDLDLARNLGFNAVVFQVRPQCDAMYESSIEPWSEFLTGEMGKGQKFDPLRFIIAEAHARGILVHAWFNPYRALHFVAKTVSPNHISKRRPDLVRKYGRYLWLDPTEPEVQEYSLSVVMDVVRRYDIDGVHFDDYFYPYKEKGPDGKDIEFPDDPQWEKYTAGGGKLSRSEWRRRNVDRFIESVGREVRKAKPHVMFGISPFGIWQPMPELGISGFNAYAELYADAKKWLEEGTVDYLAPQLYWETARRAQSFPILFDWWKGRNPKGRHVWPGIASYRIGSTETFTAGEIASQIGLTRKSGETRGSIQFSFKSVRNDMGGIQKKLKEEVFADGAIVPLSEWKPMLPPSAPSVSSRVSDGKILVNWKSDGDRTFWHVVQILDGSGWKESVHPKNTRNMTLPNSGDVKRIVVRAADRLGNLSAPSAVELTGK